MNSVEIQYDVIKFYVINSVEMKYDVIKFYVMKKALRVQLSISMCPRALTNQTYKTILVSCHHRRAMLQAGDGGGSGGGVSPAGGGSSGGDVARGLEGQVKALRSRVEELLQRAREAEVCDSIAL